MACFLLVALGMYEPTPSLKSLVYGIPVGMLTTVDRDATLQSRPIFTQEVDEDGTLWFFASRSSQRIAAGETWPVVTVTYAHPARQRYVSVCGRVAVVDDDSEKRREIWTELARGWFKEGPDDADLVLLRLDVEHVDYWDGPTNVLTRLIGFPTATCLSDGAEPARHLRVDDPYGPEF